MFVISIPLGTEPVGSAMEATMKKRYNPRTMVTYSEGAWIYAMGVTSFIRLSREAQSVHRWHGCSRVDMTEFDAYLEQFRVIPDP